MTTRHLFVVLAILLCGLPPAYAYDASIAGAYASVSVELPTTTMVVVCHGFGCTRRTEIDLSARDRAALASLLAAGRTSAAAERRAVAAATAWFDRRVGPAAGTTHRIARANGIRERDPGQMDCIDTSRNNTSLLLVLDELHLLHHHEVEAPEARGFLIDGRGPHATAVLLDIHTGRKWAIDNWTHKYGDQPDVMPLDKWMTAR